MEKGSTGNGKKRASRLPGLKIEGSGESYSIYGGKKMGSETAGEKKRKNFRAQRTLRSLNLLSRMSERGRETKK